MKTITLKNCNFKIELYKFVRSNIGVYLNSFYYALILYNMYKEKLVIVV